MGLSALLLLLRSVIVSFAFVVTVVIAFKNVPGRCKVSSILASSKQRKTWDDRVLMKKTYFTMADASSEPCATWKKVSLSQPVEQSKILEILEHCQKATKTDYQRSLFEDLAKLKGCYVINGLASCAVGSRLVHPFEAHGFIKAITFNGNGTITFRARYINTPCTVLEKAMNMPLFRGVMSSAFGKPFTILNAFSPQQRDTANLACRVWPPTAAITNNATHRDSIATPRTDLKQPDVKAGTSKVQKLGYSNVNHLKKQILLAGGDNGQPYVLDLDTLATIGPLGTSAATAGRIRDTAADSSGGAGAGFEVLAGAKMLAHTRYDAQRQRLVMASCQFELEGPGKEYTRLHFREFDAAGNLVAERIHRTDFIVVHDWIITDNYYVVPKNPAVMQWSNLAKFISGYARGVDVFRMNHAKNGEILLIPRRSNEDPVLEAATDSFFNIFHLGPTYERLSPSDGGRELVFNAVVFDHYEFGEEMGFSMETQSFDPTAWSNATGKAAAPRLDEFIIALPAVQPPIERDTSLGALGTSGASVWDESESSIIAASESTMCGFGGSSSGGSSGSGGSSSSGSSRSRGIGSGGGGGSEDKVEALRMHKASAVVTSRRRIPLLTRQRSDQSDAFASSISDGLHVADQADAAGVLSVVDVPVDMPTFHPLR